MFYENYNLFYLCDNFIEKSQGENKKTLKGRLGYDFIDL